MYKVKIILKATKNSFKKLFRKVKNKFRKKENTKTTRVERNKKKLLKRLVLGFLAVTSVVLLYFLLYQRSHMTFAEKVQNKLPTQLICYYEKDIYEFTFEQGKIKQLLVNDKKTKFKSYNEYLKNYTTNNESMVNLVNILTYRGYTCF